MVFDAVLIVLMLLTVGTVCIGVWQMAQKRPRGENSSNQWMQRRVFFQALALIVMSVLLFYR